MIKKIKKLLETVGEYQMSKFRTKGFRFGDEKSHKEFVSEVDIHSEQLLKKGLMGIDESLGFYGEESGKSGSKEEYWLVDPLDGTTNYLSGLPWFAISIGLIKDGESVAGYIYQPSNGDMFYALKGQGFYYNDEKQNPYLLSSSSQALIGTGFPYRSKDIQDSFFPCAQEVLNEFRGIRRYGAASLDLVYVALGFLQGFWESDLEPYDVGAALIMLKEMNIEVSNFKGEKYDFLKDRGMVVGTQIIHEKLQPILDKHYPSSMQR